MQRKQGNRERLKEKERMMAIWNLMMPSLLLQVQYSFIFLFSPLFLFLLIIYSSSVSVISRFSGILRVWKITAPSLPSLVVSTVTVLCWDNGCSFLFLLPVSCLCFLCPILWTGSWPLPSPQYAWLCEKDPPTLPTPPNHFPELRKWLAKPANHRLGLTFPWYDHCFLTQ